MENKKKFEELMKDEDFVIKILELQTPDEIKTEFASNGVQISDKEIEELTRDFEAMIKKLDEEYLSSISGGTDPVPPELTENWKQRLVIRLKKYGEQILNKAVDKIGESIGLMITMIPTAVLTWYIKKKLDAYDKAHFNES